MDYIIGDILYRFGIKSFGQLPAAEAQMLKPPMDGVRSYIIMLLPYHSPEQTGARNVARFASFPDYHKAVGGMLADACAELKKQFRGESFVPSVDNSPIAEVSSAAKCGLGVIGKNGLLISRQYGTYCFIAEIATTMELANDCGAGELPECENCGRCIENCPTGALSEAGFDCAKCVSHITQKKGVLSPQEEAAVAEADFIWGCDRCQEVCPKNVGITDTDLPCFTDTTPFVTEDMVNDDEFFNASAFAWRGKKTILRNIAIKNRAKMQ